MLVKTFQILIPKNLKKRDYSLDLFTNLLYVLHSFFDKVHVDNISVT